MLNFPNPPIAVGTRFPDPAIPGLPVWTYDGEKWVSRGEAGIGDAPNDGMLYGRRSGAWDSIRIPEIPEDTSVVPIGGQLRVIGIGPSAQIGYFPFNGGWMRVNGNDYPLPATGVRAGNTNVTIDGVAGQNLAVSTVYYVYLYDNGSGALAIEYSQTGRATSSTPGNVGMEIKQGDDSRSLIGIVLTHVTGHFVDTAQARYVASWLNQRPRPVQNTFYQITASTFTTILSSFTFVSFAGPLSLTLSGSVHASVAGTVVIGLNVNGTGNMIISNFLPAAYGETAISYAIAGDVNDGIQTVYLVGHTDAGSMSTGVVVSGLLP